MEEIISDPGIKSKLKKKDQPPIVVGICGGFCSGKSFIIKWLKNQFEQHSVNVCVLKEKNFLKEINIQNPEDREQYIKNYDFDSYFAVDWELFEHAINSLRKRQPFNTPIYDIFASKRLLKTKSQKPGDLIIIEGRVFLNNENIRNILNLKVFLNSDLDLMLSRRVIKGLIRKIPLEDIIERYLKHVKPGHQKWVEPTKMFAEIIVPNFANDSLDLNKSNERYEFLQILYDLLEFRMINTDNK